MKRMVRKAAVCLAAAWLAVPLAAQFKKEQLVVHKLDNGLKIILLEDHKVPQIAHFTFFKVGSRNERVGLTGVSHFIEHMMFNGTEKFGPGEFDRNMEFNGGANNAYTSDDLTAYTSFYPPAALEKMVEMEADRMQGLIFDAKVFESERQVIASERRLGDNRDEEVLYEVVRATAIMAHPYHWQVIGWMSDILHWQRDQVIQYYRTYYAPNNAVLVMVGDFSTPRMLELLKAHYGKIPAGPPPPPVTTVEPTQSGERRVTVRREVQTPSFLMVWPAPAAAHADYAALKVLDLVLLRGESCRLYRRLVRDEQLALDVGGGIDKTIDPMLFAVTVKPRPGADLARIEAIVEEELRKVAVEGPTERELLKAKNIIRSGFYMPLQTSGGKANLLGQCEVLYGDYAAAFTLIDRFTPLGTADITAAAKKYLSPQYKTVGCVLPAGGAK